MFRVVRVQRDEGEAEGNMSITVTLRGQFNNIQFTLLSDEEAKQFSIGSVFELVKKGK